MLQHKLTRPLCFYVIASAFLLLEFCMIFLACFTVFSIFFYGVFMCFTINLINNTRRRRRLRC